MSRCICAGFSLKIQKLSSHVVNYLHQTVNLTCRIERIYLCCVHLNRVKVRRTDLVGICMLAKPDHSNEVVWCHWHIRERNVLSIHCDSEIIDAPDREKDQCSYWLKFVRHLVAWMYRVLVDDVVVLCKTNKFDHRHFTIEQWFDLVYCIRETESDWVWLTDMLWIDFCSI